MIVDENGQADEFLQLLHRARAGDTCACGELIQNHHKLLLAMANDHLCPELQGKEGASDIVGYAKLNAYTSFHLFRGEQPADLHRWLRTIVNNVTLDRIKYYQAEMRDCRREQPLNGIQDDSQNKNLNGGYPTPSEFVSGKEDLAQVEQAILGLPEDLRHVVELRYRQYYSFPEISNILSITIDKVTYRWLKAVYLIKEKVCPDH